MNIDWLTVGAQIINFVVLVLLLKRFLYGPLINAMDQRERDISNRLLEATDKIHVAEEEEQRFIRKTEELEQQSESILEEAKRSAAAEREQAFEKLRQEISEASELWKRDVEREKDEFLRIARAELAQQVIALTRRALSDLAEAELETFIIKTFVKQLSTVDKSVTDAIAETCKRTKQPITIATTFEASEDTIHVLRENLDRLFGETLDVVFKTDEQLVCGISLIAPTRKITWSIDAYLDDIQEDLSKLLRSTNIAAQTA